VKNRKLFHILVLVLMAVVMAACPGPKTTPPPEKIRIGAILPLTGEVGYLGVADRNALQLFAEQNQDVEFIYEDSKGTPKDGLSSVNKLASQGVKYYITSLSYIVNTVQPVLDREKSLNFTLNMDPRSEERSPYTMRLYVTFYDEMDKLVELAQRNNAKRVAVLYVNVESMNNAVENYLRGRLKQLNIELETETYEFGAKDFRQPLLKLSANSPDVLRILDYGDKLGIILKQLSESGRFRNAAIVSGLETLVTDYKQFPVDVINRYQFTSPKFLLDESNPVVQAYAQRYGSAPNFDAMFAFDIAKVMVPAIRKHGYNNVDQVVKEITDMKTFTGAAAEYSINVHGGISPKIYWAKIQDGNIRFSE
jgi:branched-chain amino acid transport system substrate-binding protein